MPKVYIVDGNYQYKELFREFGFTVITSLHDEMPDLICFTGGEDVSPSLYGEERHPQTYSCAFRDNHETKLFTQFLEANIPMVGICRGGQFLNVMNGGKMYQHVNMHAVSHEITDVASGGTVMATSTHHQMMRPGVGSKLIATANRHGFKQHMVDGKINALKEEELDTEIVFYPNTRCLCFQPHPEFGTTELRIYFFNLIALHLDI